MNIGVSQVFSWPVARGLTASGSEQPTEPRRVIGQAKIDASALGNMLFAACPNDETSGLLPGASRPAAHAMQEIERKFIRVPH